jgi:hypothetical protein
MLRKTIHQYFMEPRCERDHWKVQEAEAKLLHVLIVDSFGANTEDKRVGDTVTVPLGMQHMVLRE